MSEADAKAMAPHYLQSARQSLLWKLEGLSEYDIRRPLTPTGTNLLGLVKHLSIVEAWYFGLAFDRPFPERGRPRARQLQRDNARPGVVGRLAGTN